MPAGVADEAGSRNERQLPWWAACVRPSRLASSNEPSRISRTAASDGAQGKDKRGRAFSAIARAPKRDAGGPSHRRNPASGPRHWLAQLPPVSAKGPGLRRQVERTGRAMTGADPAPIVPRKCEDVVLDLLAAVLIEMMLAERPRAKPELPSEQSRPTEPPCPHEESKAS
jgi:hypothetical protein